MQKVLKIVNLLLGLGFIVTVVGIILYRFGSEDISGSLIAYNLHQYGGISFIFLAVIHIYLNRKWLKSVYFSRKKELS